METKTTAVPRHARRSAALSTWQNGGGDAGVIAPHKIASHGARKLRTAAAVIETVLQVRGDDGSRLAAEVKEMRATADVLDKLAVELAPSAAIVRWSRGTGSASKNYRPGPPGRPS